MSGNTEKVFNALKASVDAHASLKIEVTKESYFGPRKVVVNGESVLFRDLITKVNEHVKELLVLAKERPDNLKEFNEQILALHRALVITKQLDRQGGICFGLFTKIFGGRSEEIGKISHHLGLVNRYIHNEHARKFTTLKLLLDPKEEPSLTTLKGLDIMKIARDLPSIEHAFQVKIKALSPETRQVVEKKMQIMKDMVENFIADKTLSIILDGNPQWNTLDLRKMDIIQIKEDFPKIESAFHAKIADIPPSERALAEDKLKIMKEMVAYAGILHNDSFKNFFINEVVLYRLELKNEGISDAIPPRLELAKEPDAAEKGHYVDSKGDLFDHMRQKRTLGGTFLKGDSLIDKFTEFCQKREGDYRVIRKWYQAQAGDSWSLESRKFKNIFMSYRRVAESKIWKGPTPKGQVVIATEQERKTARMHFAFKDEVLSKIDFPGKNADGTITLYRTISKEVLEMHGITKMSPVDEHIMPQGAGESYSLTTVSVYGTEVAESRMPSQRVLGGFPWEPLLTDSEQEFFCMTDDIPFKYTHSVPPSQNIA